MSVINTKTVSAKNKISHNNVETFTICGKTKTISTNDDGLLVFTGHQPDDIIFHTVIQSPYSQKAHMFLLCKQIPFVIKYVNPLRLLTYTVPTFELKNGRYMSESSELGAWLEDNFPGTPSILPAHIRQQQMELEATLSKLLVEPLFQVSRPHMCKGSLSLKAKTLWTQCKNCWRMGWCMEDTIPGGCGWIKYVWPIFGRLAPPVKAVVDNLYNSTGGKSAVENTENALDIFERELKIATEAFNKTQPKGAPQRDENDVVLLSQSLTDPGMADLTAFSAITAAHRMGFYDCDGYLHRPAVMRWVRKMDSIMEEKQHRGVILKDSEGDEVSYFPPPLIPEAVVRNCW